MEIINWLESKREQIKQVKEVDQKLYKMYEVHFVNGHTLRLDAEKVQTGLEKLGLIQTRDIQNS